MSNFLEHEDIFEYLHFVVFRQQGIYKHTYVLSDKKDIPLILDRFLAAKEIIAAFSINELLKIKNELIEILNEPEHFLSVDLVKKTTAIVNTFKQEEKNSILLPIDIREAVLFLHSVLTQIENLDITQVLFSDNFFEE